MEQGTPNVGAAADLEGLRSALAAAGFDADRVDEAVTPSSGGFGLIPIPVMARRMAPGDPLAVLIALFIHGAPVPEGAADRVLAPLGVAGAERLGLLAADGAEARATLRLVPVGDLLIASDRLDHHGPDFVMGVAPSSRSLANLTVRRPAARALDLGTGTGIQALLAAAHAESVVAVEVNPRALAFARFNLALSQVANVDLVEGSWFEGVTGEVFDLIVSNPPFVVSPDAELLYRDGAEPGDALSRSLVEQAPAHLAEDGLAQFLINWVHPAQGDWAAPVRAWVADRPCDGWLLRGGSDDPVSYAAQWNHHLAGTPGALAATLDRWMAWFAAAGVEAIGFGLVTLRRRDAGASTPAWFRADDLPSLPDTAAGDQIAGLIDAHDRLGRVGGIDGLLASTPTTVTSHHLEQVLVPMAGRYEVERAVVRVDAPIAFTADVDVYGATLLTLLDGRRTVREAAATAAEVLEDAPGDEELERRTAELVGSMVAMGLVRLPAR